MKASKKTFWKGAIAAGTTLAIIVFVVFQNSPRDIFGGGTMFNKSKAEEK